MRLFFAGSLGASRLFFAIGLAAGLAASCTPRKPGPEAPAPRSELSSEQLRGEDAPVTSAGAPASTNAAAALGVTSSTRQRAPKALSREASGEEAARPIALLDLNGAQLGTADKGSFDEIDARGRVSEEPLFSWLQKLGFAGELVIARNRDGERVEALRGAGWLVRTNRKGEFQLRRADGTVAFRGSGKIRNTEIRAITELRIGREP